MDNITADMIREARDKNNIKLVNHIWVDGEDGEVKCACALSQLVIAKGIDMSKFIGPELEKEDILLMVSEALELPVAYAHGFIFGFDNTSVVHLPYKEGYNADLLMSGYKSGTECRRELGPIDYHELIAGDGDDDE